MRTAPCEACVRGDELPSCASSCLTCRSPHPTVRCGRHAAFSKIRKLIQWLSGRLLLDSVALLAVRPTSHRLQARCVLFKSAHHVGNGDRGREPRRLVQVGLLPLVLRSRNHVTDALPA